MKPALSDEPTTNETPLARAAGKTCGSAFLWSISEYCEASEQADVRVSDVQQLHDRFRPDHAEAPALDDPFLPHSRRSREGPLASNLELLLARRRHIGIVGREVG